MVGSTTGSSESKPPPELKIEPSYELHPDTVSRLVSGIPDTFQLAAPLPNLMNESGVAERYLLVVPGTHPVSNVARSKELEGFAKAFDYNAQMMRNEYSHHEDTSVFLMILEPATGSIPVVLRAIEGKSKTVIDLRERTTSEGEPFYEKFHQEQFEHLAGSSLVELATVSRLGEKSLHDNLLLYAGTTRWILDRGLDLTTACLDPNLYKIFSDLLGMNWKTLVGDKLTEVDYHSSGVVIPAYLDNREVLASIRARSAGESGEIAALVLDGIKAISFSAPIGSAGVLSRALYNRYPKSNDYLVFGQS